MIQKNSLGKLFQNILKIKMFRIKNKFISMKETTVVLKHKVISHPNTHDCTRTRLLNKISLAMEGIAIIPQTGV